MNLKSFQTKDYGDFAALRLPKNKANSKPISKGKYMKRYRLTWLSVVISLALLLQVGCQQQAKAPGIGQKEAPTAAGKQGPKIKFDNVVHEFGEIAAGKKYEAEFKFKNTGDSPLKITEVKRCCGVVTRLSKMDYKPGERGVIKIEYTSARSASLMLRKIYVSSNDKENPKVELTLKAKVVPKVAYEPQRLELVLKEENAGCPEIKITSADKQPFSIKSFRSTGDSITADFDPSMEATEFVLRPKVDLEKLQIRPVGFISIYLTHPEAKRIYLSFRTKLRFQITPHSIILFNPAPQKPVLKKLSVVSNYDEDFEIESTSSENGLVKVIGQEKTDKGYNLDVETIPPPPDETGRFNDVLYLVLKDGHKLSIKCYGRYIKLESNSDTETESESTDNDK